MTQVVTAVGVRTGEWRPESGSESSAAEQFAELSTSERAEALAGLSDEQIADLQYDWSFWARPKQMRPDGDWFGCLYLAGRGWGKTRVGAETVRGWVEEQPTGHTRHLRIALVAETSSDARDVLVQGESGLLAVSRPDFMPAYEPSKRRVTWPCGCQATTYSGEEPGQLRGPQFDKALVDELAKYKYPQEAWDNLEFGLRLGDHPQVVVTTTPRPIPIIIQMVADPMFVVTRGTSYENASNLAPKFITRIIGKYEGTRVGRQELLAEILADVPGALWTREMLDNGRRLKAPELVRIVVGVDPSASAEGDETGIIVCGKDAKGDGWVLEDATVSGSPDKWARAVVAAFHRHNADRIVPERNNGGEMVELTIRTVDRNVPIRTVWASRGKGRRAEPIAALYESGRIHHVGNLARLEDQMVMLTTEEYLGAGSPDRADALVWALSDLMLKGSTSYKPSDWATW